MKKQFEKRVRLVVYLDQAEHEALKERCGSSPVATYVRWLLGRAGVLTAQSHHQIIEELETGINPAVPSTERKPCKHGLLFCKKCK